MTVGSGSHLGVSQSGVKVDVRFYDDAEKTALARYVTAEAMRNVVAEGVTIPTADFLAYYLFYRMRIGTAGYRDYQAIHRKLQIALAEMDESIEFNGESVCTGAGVKRLPKEITGHFGEAVGLGVASRIHGMTPADWAPIPEQQGRGAQPGFDYQTGSDGRQIIQIENKGSAVEYNQEQCPAVKTHKSNIAAKKKVLKEYAAHGRERFPAGLRYGTIAVMDPRRDGHVVCWLVDPPADKVERTPAAYRLVTRMRYLRDLISFVSPRSQLASSLATRVADLETLRDPFELDGVPLLRGNGQPFEFDTNKLFGSHAGFFANKTWVSAGHAGGISVPLSERQMAFIGLREDLVTLACKQGFKDVLSMSYPSATRVERVDCTISLNRFKRANLPVRLLEAGSIAKSFATFALAGMVHYSTSGLVFGILPIEPVGDRGSETGALIKQGPQNA